MVDTKPHGFLKHTPGPGVGGHCLPIDPMYLTWLCREKLGRPFRFSELPKGINDSMPVYVVDRAREILGSLAGENFSLVVIVTDHDEFDNDKNGTSARRVTDTTHRMANAAKA